MEKSILWKLLVVAQVVLFPTMIFASKPPDDAQKQRLMEKTYRIQVPFIENKGQIENKNVSFYARTFGGTLFVEKDGTLTYNLPFEDKRGVVIKEIFTEKRIRVKGLNPSLTKINHFKGNEKNNWRSNIPSYNSISLGEVYKGINLTLKVYGNNVEKLFTVLPGRDPEKIKVKLKGAKELRVNENGELEVITKLGPVKFTKPLAYQTIGDEKKLVEVAYHITNEIAYGFKIGNYDKKRPLIIDPLLASTFIGGSEKECPWTMVLDGSGNVYVGGYTSSLDYPEYPTIPGAYDRTLSEGEDIIVSKLDSSLSSLLASTCMGGGDVDLLYCMALDASGNVYMTGYTYSSDYPTTPGAYDESHNGECDAFVSKLDSTLSSLLASTFIGGGSDSQSLSMVLDGSGNVYTTGYTDSPDFPTTPGAYDESHNGDGDAFVAKLDSTLSSLLASTFMGGSLGDNCASIALDGSGNVYITGGANSPDFPTTPSAYDESHNGKCDSYVSKLDSTLSSLLASTFIGGSRNGYGLRMVLDGSGNVYITGDTDSPDFPTTPGAYEEIHKGYFDSFVSKLDSTLSSLLASTFINSNSAHNGRSMVLDGSGNVYVAGMTSSSDYYTTPGAYDEDYNGGIFDVFVTKLDSTLSSFQASTFIGGSDFDGAITMSLDGSGNVYVAGRTSSPEYPITSGAYDESYNGGIDVFVSMFDSDLSSDTASTTTTALTTTTTIGDYCPTEKIYGEYSEKTKMLRGFRDDVLSKTSEGQEIIKLYYEWSPIIVKAMEEDKKFRKEMKSIIDEFLSIIRMKVE